jgi:hypothetical protein
MRRQRAARLGGLLAALLSLTGCGDARTAKVRGTVRVDGEPLKSGSILFVPADGKSPTAGGAIKDGHYAVEVPRGLMKVTISAPKVVGKKPVSNTPTPARRTGTCRASEPRGHGFGGGSWNRPAPWRFCEPPLNEQAPIPGPRLTLATSLPILPQ